VAALVSCVVLCVAVRAEPAVPFASRQITPSGEYTFGIEGPAADLAGNLYVVNFQRPGTIGKLAPGASHSEPFIDLPAGSVGNAIRFDRQGTMLVADYKGHTIFALAGGSADLKPLFFSERFNQPNDLTVASDGTIYASDPNWKARTGQIWRITRGADGAVRGEVMTAPRAMGTTNGIDLSPDGRMLYVGESGSGQVWRYAIRGNELVDATLLKAFEPNTIDGIRTDRTGRLLVARILKGAIDIVSPQGRLEREITLQGMEPTNLAFGGPDGRSVYVTQRQGGYIEMFRTDQEGREHCVQTGAC